MTGSRGQRQSQALDEPPTHLAYRLWDPEPAAAVGQAHGRLQAHLVAHGDVEGLGAAVVAPQGLGQGGVRAPGRPCGWGTEPVLGAGGAWGACSAWGTFRPLVGGRGGLLTARGGEAEARGVGWAWACRSVGADRPAEHSPHSPCPGRPRSGSSEERSPRRRAGGGSGSKKHVSPSPPAQPSRGAGTGRTTLAATLPGELPSAPSTWRGPRGAALSSRFQGQGRAGRAGAACPGLSGWEAGSCPRPGPLPCSLLLGLWAHLLQPKERLRGSGGPTGKAGSLPTAPRRRRTAPTDTCPVLRCFPERASAARCLGSPVPGAAQGTAQAPSVPAPPHMGPPRGRGAGRGAQRGLEVPPPTGNPGRTAGLPEPRPGTQEGRAATGRAARGGAGSHLVPVQGVLLQPVHLQQLLGHPDAGQVREDAQVAGHPEAWGGQRAMSQGGQGPRDTPDPS